MMLMPPVDLPPEVKREYWSWFEDRLLVPIKEQDPDLYSWIIEWHRKRIAEMADKSRTEWERNDG